MVAGGGMEKLGFGGCATVGATQLPPDVDGDAVGVLVVTRGVGVVGGASLFRQGPINVAGQVLVAGREFAVAVSRRC